MKTKYGWTAALAGLLAAAAACSDDGGTGTVQPAEMVSVSATTQEGTVGAAAAAPPAVRVSDGRGRPVAGVPVTFAVTAGGGTVAGTEVRTNINGHATAGTWTFGRTAGQNAVSATVAGFPATVFTAQAAAGAPARLVPHAGDDQSAAAGRAVAVDPAVRVTDAFGNAVAGVHVSFVVSGGGGTVAGGTAGTDASGVAAVGSWSLGAPGTNTLIASVGELHATFTATALDPCASSTAYTFGATVAGELDPFDCRLAGGQRVDFFSLALPEARSFVAELQGAGAPFLYLFDAAGRVVAAEPSRGAAGARLQVLGAPAGSYFIGASGAAAPEGPVLPGTYSLRTTAAGNDVAGCPRPWLVGPTTTTQQLTTADQCFSFQYSDVFQVYLRAGQTIVINQSSSAFDAFLALVGPAGNVVASNDDFNGLNSRITYTASAQGAYTIIATSLGGSSVGQYTLSVQ